MRNIVQVRETLPDHYLGSSVLAFIAKHGGSFCEVYWYDRAVRVRYCSAVGQIERHHVRHEWCGPDDASDDVKEQGDCIAIDMSAETASTDLGSSTAPDGVSVLFDDDSTDDDITEELNANCC